MRWLGNGSISPAFLYFAPIAIIFIIGWRRNSYLPWRIQPVGNPVAQNQSPADRNADPNHRNPSTSYGGEGNRTFQKRCPTSNSSNRTEKLLVVLDGGLTATRIHPIDRLVLAIQIRMLAQQSSTSKWCTGLLRSPLLSPCPILLRIYLRQFLVIPPPLLLIPLGLQRTYGHP